MQEYIRGTNKRKLRLEIILILSFLPGKRTIEWKIKNTLSIKITSSIQIIVFFIVNYPYKKYGKIKT